MKVNRMVVGLCLGLLTMSFLMIGCAGKYSDVKEMNEKFIDLVEDYVEGLGKADSAQDAAKAMNRFADGMEDLWPKMQALSEKYPELKDESNLPEELKESQKRAEEMGKKMAGVMMKLMPFMSDPDVQKAQKRLGAVMTDK